MRTRWGGAKRGKAGLELRVVLLVFLFFFFFFLLLIFLSSFPQVACWSSLRTGKARI